MGGAQDPASALVGLTEFYSANASVLGMATSIDLSSGEPTPSALEGAMGVFAETASVLADGLTALSSVYPPIAIVAAAFKVVIELDIQRRDNNKKVVERLQLVEFGLCDTCQAGLVKLQLQDTVSVLFQ